MRPLDLDDEKVRTLYREISNWDRWGADDERGTLNHIGADERLAALRLVRDGVSIGLGNPLDTVPSPMNTLPAQHYMVQAGDMMPDRGPGVAYDFIGVYPHGQAQSHLDAMCHISHDGKLYGGRARSLVTSKGSRTLAITAAADGIIGRGVLLDIAAARGTDWIDPDMPIRPEDFDAAEKRAGVTVGKGDIVIYRTGRHERRAAAGPQVERLPNGGGNLPGIYPDCLKWLHHRDVALIGADCAHDVLPAPFTEEWIPIHVGTEVYMGMLLLHNLGLARLVDHTHKTGRSDFCFVASPLNLLGATASPINPIALF